jgi:hypothetical protein
MRELIDMGVMMSVEVLPNLTLSVMANQAAEVMKLDQGWGVQGDLACHVLALIEQLRNAAEACVIAYQHLDTFGVVQGDGSEREVSSQNLAFEALRPFCVPVGHSFRSVYERSSTD